jgi:hypothetical protein
MLTYEAQLCSSLYEDTDSDLKINSVLYKDPLRWPRNTLYPQKLALLRQQAAVAR